jgi:hypothetical protein
MLLPVLSFGQAKVATAVAQFLEISPTPRAEGMGSAFIGVADDISTIHYNPAGLAWQLKKQAMFSHTLLYGGINLEWAAVSMPTLGGVVALSSAMLSTGSMDETTPYMPEGTGRTFSASCLSVCATYSLALTDRFSVGINGKYIGENLADVTGNGWGFDVGTYFRTAFKDIRLGMKLSNFGPDIKYLTQSFPLPMAFHFGAAGELLNNGTHRITLDVEGSHPNDNLEKFQIGTEYAYKETAFLRGGYKIQYDIDKFSLGGGVKLPLGGLSTRADYSFTYVKYLTPVHRFSLGIEF